MALSGQIGAAGGTPQSLEVRADVSLGPDPAGGFRLTGIKLTVRGEVDGLDAAGFASAAQAAKEGCPVSKALTGVDITLDAASGGLSGTAQRSRAASWPRGRRHRTRIPTRIPAQSPMIRCGLAQGWA